MHPSDVLSDLFRTLRLRSDLYFTARFASAYSVAIPPEGKRVRFHLLRQGSCWLTNADGSDGVQLGPGDLAIVPNGVGHVLAHAAISRPLPLADVLSAETLDPASGVLTYGKGAPSAVVLCGFCAFDEDIRHPLFTVIPDRIILTVEETSSRPSMATAIRLLSEEADLAAAGMSGILSRLLEIVFMQAMRDIGRERQAQGPQFLLALADRNLSKALRAIHLQPEHPWTAALLAQQAGMSRTRFSVKFSAMIGEAPMAYLSNWRLAKARLLLSDTNLSIDEIGRRCGYQSLPAFSRRFKSVFGEGPGGFRRSLRSSPKNE